MLTSITTLIVVGGLLFLGGEIIHDFAFSLFAGVLVGTYSSIYVASPTALFIHERLGKGKDAPIVSKKKAVSKPS